MRCLNRECDSTLNKRKPARYNRKVSEHNIESAQLKFMIAWGTNLPGTVL